MHRRLLPHAGSPASLNVERNCSRVPKITGIQKCINAQSSVRLFWIGVPVISNRLGITKFSLRTLYKTCKNRKIVELHLSYKTRHNKMWEHYTRRGRLSYDFLSYCVGKTFSVCGYSIVVKKLRRSITVINLQSLLV